MNYLGMNLQPWAEYMGIGRIYFWLIKMKPACLYIYFPYGKISNRNDGISVTFLLENGVKQNETFSYSTLFVTRRKYGYPKTSLALFMLLAGDVEVNPGPSLHDDKLSLLLKV